jgi:hypothetical protein
MNGDTLASSNVHDILSCTELRTFWISWSDSQSSHISVGKGTAVDNEQFLVYKNDISLITIAAYSVASEDTKVDFRLGASMAGLFVQISFENLFSVKCIIQISVAPRGRDKSPLAPIFSSCVQHKYYLLLFITYLKCINWTSHSNALLQQDKKKLYIM